MTQETNGLYLTAEVDYNEALDPQLVQPVLDTLAKRYDLKYAIISSFDEICKEIDEAAKTGRLVSVFLSAHGNSQGMLLKNTLDMSRNGIHKNLDFKNCFEGLESSGRIVLLSSDTGAVNQGNAYDNLAQKMATAVQRVVIAPTDMLYSSGVKIIFTHEPIQLKY